ncbi:MAG: transglycosylase domain-containing protein [Candidatus Saccharimonadales bacterium]
MKRFAKRRWEWFRQLTWWQKTLLTASPFLAFLIATPILTYLYYYNDIGDQERLMNRNNTGIVLYDKNDKPFFGIGKAEHRAIIPLDQIPKDLQHALIASEDKDFYKHGGFQFTSILRALYGNILSREITGGGSTITQQLAKNLLLTSQQTVMRKYQELIVAEAIEQRYTKDEILTMYINSVHYGENTFGVEEAAKTYFNKSPKDLTLAESAMLIGVLPAPSYYSPISGDSELAKGRQEEVLIRMVRNGYITEDKKTAALAEKLMYAEQTAADNSAPHFTEMILNELYDKYGEEKSLRSGYQVHTTLDLSLQASAKQSVDAGMAHIDANGGSNASLVAIDPKTGGILALVGSRDYDNEQFGKTNMATIPRQPGSTFKSIYYADALASGKITPTTVIKDEATDFGGGYKPQNACRCYYGNVTVRQALDWSLNIPAVKVMQMNGIEASVTRAKELGITTLDKSTDYGLSLAIGSAEVPLTEMTSAYGAFANAGVLEDRYSIEQIEDKFDQVIYRDNSKFHRAVSEQGAYLLSNILSDNATRSKVFGSSLNVTGTDGKVKNVAVKTGTTDESRDAWTIGYTPDIVVGVWTGNNDNTMMLSGGSDMAGPIWRRMMGQAIGMANPTFVQPSGIIKVTVCTTLGGKSDVFLTSHVPQRCNEPQKERPSDNQPSEPDEARCTIAGKEYLLAIDPQCQEDMCSVEGLENLAANDPNCVTPQDDDDDGLASEDDTCQTTPAGTSVDSAGCPVDRLPLTP